MEGFRISEAAELVRLHPVTLRRYEAKGILPTAKRHPLGWRIYTPDDIREMKRRLKAKEPVGA